MIEGCGHRLMHRCRIRTFHETGCVAVAPEEIFQLFSTDAREQGRVINLVTVEIQDWQYRTVTNGVDKLVDVPGGCERPSLGLTVANHCGHNQIGIVERGAAGVRQNITQLASLDRKSVV